MGAFGWALLQVPRALLWQLREPELRGLTAVPAVVTLGVGLALFVTAFWGAGAIAAGWADWGAGFVADAARLAGRAVLTVVLLSVATLLTWQLQGAIAAAALQRMALYVQRTVDGSAPPPTMGALAVVALAARSLFPRLKSLVAFLLTSLAAATLVLVPVVGPALVVGAQALIGALFLSHGAIADNRARLGLPRLLVFRETAVFLGLATALVPLFLVPPLLLVSGGAVAISGALVAVGARRRRERLGGR